MCNAVTACCLKLVAPGRSHPGLFLTLPRIASKTNGPQFICSGSGRAAVSGPWPKNVLLANTSRGASIRVYLVIIISRSIHVFHPNSSRNQVLLPPAWTNKLLSVTCAGRGHRPVFQMTFGVPLSTHPGIVFKLHRYPLLIPGSSQSS